MFREIYLWGVPFSSGNILIMYLIYNNFSWKKITFLQKRNMSVVDSFSTLLEYAHATKAYAYH